MNYNGNTYETNGERRENDCRLENELADFMEEHFWKKLNKTTFERVFDKDRQVLGMDFIINNGKASEKIIDDKLKIYGLINKPIESISFEVLRRVRSGEYREGWFIDSRSKTTHYGFITVFTKESELSKITKDNVEKVVYLLVSKDEVKKFIDKATKTLLEDSYDLIASNERFTKYATSALVYSMNLKEKPVNVCVYRKFLKELPSTIELEISRDAVRKLN